MIETNYQSLNEVQIEGILQEVDLRTGTTRTEGKSYMGGTITIHVAQDYNGIHEESDIPIKVFATEMTRAGKPNPAYQNLQQIMNWKRVTVDGRENADYVRFSGSGGEIQENAYIPEGRTEPLSTWEVRASFFQKGMVTPDTQSRAVFKNEIYIRSMGPEVVNDEETGRLIISGILFTYGTRANVVKYFVEDSRAIAYINQNWHEGDVVVVSGRIRNAVRMRKANTSHREIEGGFGEEIDMGITGVAHELVITAGSPSGRDFDLSDNDVREAMQERKRDILERAEKANRKSTPNTTNTSASVPSDVYRAPIKPTW